MFGWDPGRRDRIGHWRDARWIGSRGGQHALVLFQHRAGAIRVLPRRRGARSASIVAGLHRRRREDSAVAASWRARLERSLLVLLTKPCGVEFRRRTMTSNSICRRANWSSRGAAIEDGGAQASLRGSEQLRLRMVLTAAEAGPARSIWVTAAHHAQRRSRP